MKPVKFYLGSNSSSQTSQVLGFAESYRGKSRQCRSSQNLQKKQVKNLASAHCCPKRHADSWRRKKNPKRERKKQEGRKREGEMNTALTHDIGRVTRPAKTLAGTEAHFQNTSATVLNLWVATPTGLHTRYIHYDSHQQQN